MFRKLIFMSLSLIFAIALGIHTAEAQLATSSPLTVTVSPSQMNGWFFYDVVNKTVNNSLGSFMTGPGVAPMGTSSAQITVNGSSTTALASSLFGGTLLSSISDLHYQTYNGSGTSTGTTTRSTMSGVLFMDVDFNNGSTSATSTASSTPSSTGRLFFIPSLNGSITPNTWKDWNTINKGMMDKSQLWIFSGQYWPAYVTGSSTATSTAFTTPGSSPMMWKDILARYPGIRIASNGLVGIQVGPYANGYTENIDRFTFRAHPNMITRFNFEQDATSTATSTATTTPSIRNNATRVGTAVSAFVHSIKGELKNVTKEVRNEIKDAKAEAHQNR